MENFYLKKLTEQRDRTTPTTPPPGAVNKPWWDTTPQQAPLDTTINPTQHYPIQQTQPAPTKAQSANFNDRCPVERGGCGSSNYMPIGNAWKCFECGFPIIQTTSGVGISNAPGQSSQPSRQVAHGGLTNNFHPGEFIAHL